MESEVYNIMLYSGVPYEDLMKMPVSRRKRCFALLVKINKESAKSGSMSGGKRHRR